MPSSGRYLHGQRERRPWHWIKTTFSPHRRTSFLTLLAIALLVWAIPHLVDWLFVKAVWSGTDRTFCGDDRSGRNPAGRLERRLLAFSSARNSSSSCSASIRPDERWRPVLVAILMIIAFVPLLMPSTPRKGLNAILAFFRCCRSSAFFLLHGRLRPPDRGNGRWGGLMVTLVISFVAIAVSSTSASCLRSDAARKCRRPHAVRDLHRGHPRRAA